MLPDYMRITENKKSIMRALTELLEMMASLRDPATGSAWDLAQSFATIVPHTIEETYELQEAIEKGTPEDILAELGDVLFQIIYYSQLAKEQGWFDFSTVVTTLKEKLQRRKAACLTQSGITLEEQRTLWQTLKSKEREEKYQSSNRILSNVPHQLPALTRAQKLQDRAAAVGFDWPHIHCVVEKVHEEIEEFEEALQAGKLEAAKEELGDILFACANLSRHLKADPESIMREANRKFERRFNGVEDKVKLSSKRWEDFTLDELEEFWQEVKSHQ